MKNEIIDGQNELLILIDEKDNEIGVGDKLSVHLDGLLHSVCIELGGQGLAAGKLDAGSGDGFHHFTAPGIRNHGDGSFGVSFDLLDGCTGIHKFSDIELAEVKFGKVHFSFLC